MVRERYAVVTEKNSWSHIVGPDGYVSPPYRYKWEAEEDAEALNYYYEQDRAEDPR